MFGYRMRVRWRVLAVAISATGFAIAVSVSACADESLGPKADTSEPALVPGVNVYLEVDGGAAPPGTQIVLTAKVRTVEVERTPTAFAVDLVYDAQKLKPVSVRALDDGVLRAVNLEASPGVVKAAGAAPDGLETDVLFEIALTVLADGYTDGLGLSVRELTVVEEDFADVTMDVVMPQQVVTLRR